MGGLVSELSARPDRRVVEGVRPRAALDYATFQALLQTPFSLYQPTCEPAVLILTEATEHPADPRLENFSLRFAAADPALRLPQGSYRVEHPDLGAFELFLVPGRASSAPVFDVVFNRLRENAGRV